MTNHQTAKVEAAFRVALAEAFKTVGLAGFKRTSFFMSNRKAADLKKAA